MGGLCSRRSTEDSALAGAIPHVNGHFNYGHGIVYQSRGLNIKESNVPADGEITNNQVKEQFSFPELNAASNAENFDINDGIPHLPRALSNKSRSTRSKQVAIAKVCGYWIILFLRIILSFVVLH